MMDWYRKIVLPRLLNVEMGSSQLRKIRQDVIGQASGVVLEIGVGPGYNLSFYERIEKLYALEPSKELLRIAQQRNNASFPIEYLNVPAECIPLPDHSIDTVISTWTLCSVSDPYKVLGEIHRVLRPQGKFLFVDHGASLKQLRMILQSILTVVTKHFTGNCHYDRPIDRIISSSGFTITTIDHPHERFKPTIYNFRGMAVPRNAERG